MSLDDFQSTVNAALQADAKFAGLTILLELDDDASAEDLADQDKAFESALARTGLVIVVTMPVGEVIDSAAKIQGAVHLNLIGQVGIIENPVINRSQPNAATPDVVPAGKKVRLLLRDAMLALLAAGFDFPQQTLPKPETDAEGLVLHSFLVSNRDDLRA